MKCPLPESLINKIAARVGPEWFEWYSLTPAERWAESTRMWQTYLALGGSLDPIADPKRGYDTGSSHRAMFAHGRTGVRPVRGRGV
jgi:hypothetical protein